MASKPVGRPIQLVSPIEGADDDDLRFELNRTVVNEMLHADRLQQSLVAVISVAGAFRKGKSFLLNFFLRFLRALSRGNTQDWIRSEDSFNEGFHWRSGSERDTAGILIWSEPFFIRKPNGEEVAVILMDTQGTFDHQSTQQDCTTIFAFSTLLSSVQIFNISKDIQETDLQYLRLFVEFAAMAKNSKEKVLQDLWFLVRDWQNPDEYEWGVEGGNSYLKKILACDSRKPRENQELRRGIQQHFEKACCCLLPHPGKVVERSAFDGEVSRLEKDFIVGLEQFIPQIASPNSVVIKKVNGKELTGGKLLDLFEVYFEAFCSGKLPSPKSIFAATVEMANIAAFSEAKELFGNGIKTLSDEIANENEFSEVQSFVRMDALDRFNYMCMEPNSNSTRKLKEKLEKDLDELQRKQRVVRDLKSDVATADQKMLMLTQEMDSLKSQSEEGCLKMLQMECEFEQRLEDIRRKSIPRDEMERLVREESTRQATERQKLQAENRELCGQIDDLMTANKALSERLSRLSHQDRESLRELQGKFQHLRVQHEQLIHESRKSNDSSCSVL